MKREEMETAATVFAALARGCKVIVRDIHTQEHHVLTLHTQKAAVLRPADFENSLIVVSTEEPAWWGKEEAQKHVGFVYRAEGVTQGLVGVYEGDFDPWDDDSDHWRNEGWEGCEYAAPKWGTDPDSWDWKPCKKESA